jgi:hypothetical protein
VSVETRGSSASGCPFGGGRSPHRSLCDQPIRRRSTPTLSQAIFGLDRVTIGSVG